MKLETYHRSITMDLPPLPKVLYTSERRAESKSKIDSAASKEALSRLDDLLHRDPGNLTNKTVTLLADRYAHEAKMKEGRGYNKAKTQMAEIDLRLKNLGDNSRPSADSYETLRFNAAMDTVKQLYAAFSQEDLPIPTEQATALALRQKLAEVKEQQKPEPKPTERVTIYDISAAWKDEAPRRSIFDQDWID